MNIESIRSEEQLFDFVEGCLNDFESGLSTKEETMNGFIELLAHVASLNRQYP